MPSRAQRSRHAARRIPDDGIIFGPARVQRATHSLQAARRALSAGREGEPIMTITDLFYGLVQPPKPHHAPVAPDHHQQAWPVRLAAMAGESLGRLLQPRRPRA
jgi:hypothetical protein